MEVNSAGGNTFLIICYTLTKYILHESNAGQHWSFLILSTHPDKIFLKPRKNQTNRHLVFEFESRAFAHFLIFGPTAPHCALHFSNFGPWGIAPGRTDPRRVLPLYIHDLACSVYIQLTFQVQWRIHWAWIQLRSPSFVWQRSTKLFPHPFREKSVLWNVWARDE